MAVRTVVIGIDGAPSAMLDRLAREGVTPNLTSLRGGGFFGHMDSSVPAVSSVSWSTIITGVNPGAHGIYGFTQMMDGSYTIAYPNYNAIRHPPFWEGISGAHVVINVPMTYPAPEINGCLISGFVSPDFDKSVHPRSLLPELAAIDYQTDVDAGKAHKSKTLLVKQLNETLDARIAAYRMLWDRYDWSVFKLVFTGTDRLEHFLWDAYADEEHEMHDDFLDYFRRIDEAIGEISQRMGDDDSLVILSDHGMEAVRYNVNLNAYLLQEGILKLGDDPRRKYNNMLGHSKAFALEDGRIYMHRQGRYPRGEVAEDEVEGAVEELIDVLGRLRIDGEEVVAATHRREDIYHGQHLGKAPDLVVEPAPGYNLRGKLTDVLYEESPLAGMHNADAFLHVSQKDVVPNKPSVEDVVPIIKALNDEVP
jgi:predicted AlkP superfamily phosphohydrolase/phosphomutase